MAITDSRYTPEQWRAAPAYAGGDVQTAEAGQSQVLDSERAKLAGDPQFAGDVQSLDRQRARLTTAPSANANKLLALVGDGPPPAPSANASKLLALVSDNPEENAGTLDRGKVPITGPDAEDQLHDPRPNWLKVGMRALPGSDYTDQPFTPKGRRAIARGVVKGGLGLPGAIESGLGGDQQESHRNWLGDLVFGENSPPTDPKLLGHGTALPNSADADHALTAAGWAPDPTHKQAEDIPGLAAIGATGMTGAAQLGTGGARKVRDLVRGGTPEQLALPGDVARTVGDRTVPGARPMPPEVMPQPPDVRPNYPGPVATPGPRPVPGVGPEPTPAGDRRVMALKRAPGVTNGQPASAHAIDDELEAAAGQVQSDVGAEKADVRSNMEWQRMRDQPAPDLKPLSDHIDDLIANTAGASRRAALQAKQQVEEIIAIKDPVARHEQLDQFKRNLAEKGGVDAEGYKAIDAKRSAALKEHVDAALKDYEPFAKYAEDYSAAANKGKPFRASFMQQLGADESGSTMMQGAMRSPRNVDIGIKAAGGLEHFDPIAAKHVVGEIADLDSAGLEKWAGKNKEILDKLPQAKAAFEGVQQRVNMHSAMEGATKRFEEALQAQTKARAAESERAEAFTKMHLDAQRADMTAAQREAEQTNALQRKATDEGNAQRTAAYSDSLTLHQNAVQRAAAYEGDLRELQASLPKDRAKVVESIVKRMNNDGLITPSEHTALLQRIADAKRSVSATDAMSTLSKYVTYALTGNYLVSFGGPALVRAVKAGE